MNIIAELIFLIIKLLYWAVIGAGHALVGLFSILCKVSVLLFRVGAMGLAALIEKIREVRIAKGGA
ncbi:MAG: hypothetical protein IK089_07000 [Oxalobacter sp.]|nr:hypothetical protein [Oxalobacter sp.]